MSHHVGSAFFSAKTEHLCAEIDSNISSYRYVLAGNGQARNDECYIRNSSQKCTHWHYNLPGRETTIISEVFCGTTNNKLDIHKATYLLK